MFILAVMTEILIRKWILYYISKATFTSIKEWFIILKEYIYTAKISYPDIASEKNRYYPYRWE
jgi:hypothetical protein